MSDRVAGRVGAAMSWKAAQLGGESVVSLLRFIVLARLLDADDFGLLAIGTVTLDLVATLTNFGLIPALIQRQDPDEQHYHAAWTVGVLRGLGSALVIFAAAPLVASVFGDDDATGLVRLIALRPLLSSLTSIRIADLERELDFRSLAVMDLSGAVVQTTVAIVLAGALDAYALVAGMLVGSIVRVAISYRVAPHRPRLVLDRTAARSLFGYGRWVLATSAVGLLGPLALRVVVARELGTAELGLYYLAARLVSTPNGVISVVVSSVAFPLHAQLQGEIERATAAFRANITALLASLVPIYAAMAALAPALVRDVLGERWDGTVTLIRLLCVSALIGIVVDAVVPLNEGRGRPDRVTALVVIHAVLVLIFVWPMVNAMGVSGAALAVVVAEIPVQVIAARMATNDLPSPFRTLWRALAVSVVASCAGAAVAILVDLVAGPPTGFFIAVVFGGATGLIVMAWLDAALGAGLLEQLRKAFPFLGRVPHLRRGSPSAEAGTSGD